jgi:O-antigen biosynthesis protein
VIIVAGREMSAARRDELRALDDAVRIVDYDAPFNFSASVNLGAAHARADHLLLLNDDTEPVSPDWLTQLLDAVGGPGVGAAGARLLFEDGTLQHAGHTYRTSLDHVGFGLPGDAPGRGGILQRRRPVAGVTAACMLVPFHVYDAIGGLCPNLPGNYNDVDLCMKIRAAGWSIVYEPAAVLHHFESRSRVAAIRPEEIELIQSRWLTHLVDDPFTPALV